MRFLRKAFAFTTTLVILLTTCLTGVYAEEHNCYAVCTAPAICNVCGEAYIGENIIHNYSNPLYAYNETSHWSECVNCGAAGSPSMHSASCMKPGICSTCGSECSLDKTEHNYDLYELEHDETKHWRVCKDCGENVVVIPHFSWCDKLGVCGDCGAPYSGPDIYHIDRSDWLYDSECHWYTCNTCGIAPEHNNHNSNCQQPGICEVCHAPYSGINVSHSIERNDYEYDSEHHWYICKNCNEKVYITDHLNCTP